MYSHSVGPKYEELTGVAETARWEETRISRVLVGEVAHRGNVRVGREVRANLDITFYFIFIGLIFMNPFKNTMDNGVDLIDDHS